MAGNELEYLVKKIHAQNYNRLKSRKSKIQEQNIIISLILEQKHVVII